MQALLYCCAKDNAKHYLQQQYNAAPNNMRSILYNAKHYVLQRSNLIAQQLVAQQMNEQPSQFKAAGQLSKSLAHSYLIAAAIK